MGLTSWHFPYLHEKAFGAKAKRKHVVETSRRFGLVRCARACAVRVRGARAVVQLVRPCADVTSIAIAQGVRTRRSEAYTRAVRTRPRCGCRTGERCRRSPAAPAACARRGACAGRPCSASMATAAWLMPSHIAASTSGGSFPVTGGPSEASASGHDDQPKRLLKHRQGLRGFVRCAPSNREAT